MKAFAAFPSLRHVLRPFGIVDAQRRTAIEAEIHLFSVNKFLDSVTLVR